MMNKETIQRRALFSGFILLNTVKCLLIYCILVFWEVSRTNLLFHFGVLFFSIFMVYCVLYFSKNKGLLLTFYVIQAIYLLVNLLYFLYFKSYLTAGIVFTLFVNVHDLLSSQSIPFNSSILLLFIDVPVLIACLIQKEKTPALKTYQRLLVIVAVILVGSALLFEAYQFRLTRTASKYGGNTKYMFEYGLLGYQIKDYKENGLKHSVKKDVLFHYGKLIQSSNEEKIKKNIVFIQVESMGGDAEFLKNRDQWVMPYMHSLISRSVFYRYAMSYHMGGGTSDAEFSIINSVEPFADYPAIMLENYSYSNSFVKVLSRNGYATKAFHGNEGLFWNRLKSFREMGYQEFYDIYRMGLKEKGWGAPDSEVFDYSLNEMKKEKGPYYYHIITMTSHGPFNNVLNYYRPESYNHIESDLTRDYFISMNYVDRCISNFISRLPDPQNTIVLIYGDHCPEMPIKDYKQPYFIYKERKFEFVPLFVIAPGKKAYQENKLAVSFLSYAPTVLLNSGITFSYQSDGANLLDYPVKDGFIPLQGDLFQQSTLYQKIEDFESK